MRKTAAGRRESTCCVRGCGFVLCDSATMGDTDTVALASLALCVAHHTLDWLHERELANGDFCVRITAETGADGTLARDIAVATDLKAIAIDEKSRADLQAYVGQRLRAASWLPELRDAEGVYRCTRQEPAGRAVSPATTL